MNQDEDYTKDPHLRSRIDLFVKHSVGDCLEIGCGSGVLLEIISSNIPECKHFGIDVDKNAIDIAKSKNLKNVTFTCSDANKIILKRKFDTIILSHFIEHIINPATMLIRLKKNLKNNGKILIMLPNKNGFLNDSKNAPIGQKHYWIFDKQSITFLLSQLGFSCEFINTTLRIPFSRRISRKSRPLSDIIYNLSKILAKIFNKRVYDFFIIVKEKVDNL